MNKKFYFLWSRFFFYLAIALVLGVPFALFVPVNTLLPENVQLYHRIFNGLLYGGLLVFCYGGFAVAFNLGGFHMFKYSIKKTWQVVFNRGKGENGEKALGTYPEYLAQQKPKPEALEAFLGGLVPMIVSFVIGGIMYL